MIRAVLSSIVVLAAPLLISSAAADELRHSGTVVRATHDGLVLREMITWTGPGTGIVNREVAMTPQTAVQLVRRAPWTDDPRARPGWTAIDLRPDDVHPGDFATVTTRDGADGDVAVSVEIVRPEG